MKRLLLVCLILAVFMFPVQASFIWTNATTEGVNTMYHPQLWTEGCNQYTDQATVTTSGPIITVWDYQGFTRTSGNDGSHTVMTNVYATIHDNLSPNTNATYMYLRQQNNIDTHYYGTCDPDFYLENWEAANTPAMAYYIPSGGYIKYANLGVLGTVTITNMSYNNSNIAGDIQKDFSNTAQWIYIGLGFQPGKEIGTICAGTNCRYFTTTPPGPPIANFTGTPTNGSAPLTVVFTDTSTNGTATSWNWTSSPNTGVFVSPSTISEDATMLFTASGNYTITHCAANDLGSDCEVKTDYIWVYNSTVMITTPWRAEDMVFGGLVANATINLLDIENNTWVNVTSPTGQSSITTLSSHKLSGYGFAVGFNDAEQLIVEPQAFPGYVLYMYPTGFNDVSEGNVTVFVKAEDVDTGLSVIGATVTGQAAGGGSQVKTTNSAGWAQFVFPNNTNVHFKAEKSGYTGSTTIVLNTGVPSGGDAFVSGTVYLTKGTITVLPTTTVTTLPGGGTPTPVQTYLPHCDPAASDYSAEECRAEQSSFSLSWLADNMLLLIQICFIFTILYIAGWKP